MKRAFLLILALTLSLLTTGAPTAQANAAVSLQLQNVSPSYLTTPADVTVSLQVTSETATTTTISAWVSQSPLIGRSQVQEVTENRLAIGFEQASRIEAELVSGSNQVNVPLPASTFRGRAAGAYAVDIRVTGGADLQFLLPIWRDGASESLQVVTLLPLTATPTKVGPSSFTNDDGVAQYDEAASLLSLLRGAADTSGVAWLLDPDTVASAADLADGGRVLNPEPHDASESAVAGATAYLEELRSATADEPVYLMNFAGADVSALLDRGLVGVAQGAFRLSTQTRELLGRADLAAAVVARTGDVSDATWSWLSDQPVYLTVLSSQRWQARTSVFTPSAVVSDPNGEAALVVDQQLSRTLTLGMRADADAVAQRQALYADLLITALERPGDKRVVAMMPRTVSGGLNTEAVSSALRSLDLPWVSAVSPSQALTGQTTSDRTRVSDSVPPGFNAKFAASIKKFDQRRRALNALIADTPPNRELLSAELRIASGLYTKPRQRYQLRANAFGALGIVERSVRIVSSGSVVFPGESGVVPITILNDLEVPVSVELVAQGVPSVRVQPAPVETITIGPGKRKSLEIPTKLIGSDTAFVELQLTTTDGRKIGDEVSIQLVSSAYSRVAAWFVGAAFALLILLIAINTVRRVRVRRYEARLRSREAVDSQ